MKKENTSDSKTSVTYRIGDLSRACDTSIDTIRFYEKKGLVQPETRLKSGYRIYGSEALERLQFIKRGKMLGFSLKEITELLNLSLTPKDDCEDVKSRVHEKLIEVEQKILHLEHLRESLKKLDEACSGLDSHSTCPILHYMKSAEIERCCDESSI